MGTKVEHKNYLPGYTDMADSSVNSNGNLLRCQEIKPNRHLGDKFTIVSADGSVHYDKEMLKRTMLEHDATFRKQVYELHRLYKTQNDLMAQSQREYFNSHPSCLDTSQPMSYSSRAPAVDVKRVWQAGVTISRHDLKQPSGDLINKTGSQYSANGAPLNPNNVRSSRKMLDLELPAHIYADDDDEVEILDKKPSKSLPWTSSSVLGGNVKLNLGNSDGSSQVEKSWSTDIQPRHSSVTHLLDKPSEESSSMRKPDFLGVEVSTAQNQHYLSRGMNTRILEGNLKEQSTGKLSVASKEIRHNNSFGRKMDELSSSMAWLKYKQNVVDSSTGHYMFSPYTFNHSIIARPGFTDLLTSPWPGNNTSYTSKSLHDTGETSIANNILSSGVSKDSTQNTQHHHSLKIHGELHHQKHPPPQDFVKDINLNDAPPDTTQDDAANWDQGSRNSLVDISWLKRKPVDLMETGVPLNAKATGSAMEKYSECSSAPHSATDIAPCIKHEADTEMLSEDTVAHANKRIVIDLNEALPFMDDWEMDVCEPECDTEEHDDPSRDSLAITAAEGLLAMCNHVFPPGSPQADTLHWFADLAISKENTMFDKNSDDDFEALTLKLQETKSYEYHPAPRAQEVANNDARCSAASLLRTRPRRGRGRGRGRGRRQKKEFQKDVLPAIASLPKHEVSEDLRTLGRSTPATPTKRGGRNGQAKGRRRPRTMAVTTEEAMAVSLAPVSPPLAPADLDADVLGVTRWGRTTRRCRRPRCPPANIASLRVA